MKFRGGSPLVRTPSPRRRGHQHIDIGFSDTVSNVVEIVKEEHRKAHKHYGHHGRFPRGIFSFWFLFFFFKYFF